jgi:hypothetical protein
MTTRGKEQASAWCEATVHRMPFGSGLESSIFQQAYSSNFCQFPSGQGSYDLNIQVLVTT